MSTSKQINKKGAPKKVDHFVRSTKRSPFFFEHVDSLHSDTKVSQWKLSCPHRKSVCTTNMSHTPPPVQLNFPRKKQISSFLHQFMKRWWILKVVVIVDLVLFQACLVGQLMFIPLYAVLILHKYNQWHEHIISACLRDWELIQRYQTRSESWWSWPATRDKWMIELFDWFKVYH